MGLKYINNAHVDPQSSNLEEKSIDEESIQKWVTEAQAGSEEAFTRIVTTFASPLQLIIYRIVLDWEESRDIAQETFIRTYRALNRYKPEGKFQSWLFKIGVRQAYDLLRKKKHRPITFLQKKDQTTKEIGIRDDTVKQNEIAKLIEQAVGQLPSQQRIPFILSEYEGYGYQEIADIVGGSTKSIERHLYRAREALREKLHPYL